MIFKKEYCALKSSCVRLGAGKTILAVHCVEKTEETKRVAQQI
jgi:hypothetical protein